MAEQPEVDKEWSAQQRKLFKHKKNYRVEEIRAERKARNLVLWENIKPRIEAANLKGGQTFFSAQHLPQPESSKEVLLKPCNQSAQLPFEKRREFTRLDTVPVFAIDRHREHRVSDFPLHSET